MKTIQLKQGETIIRHFQPDKRMRLKKDERIKIPFSICWTVLVYFISSNILEGGCHFFFRILFLFFFLAAIYITIGRFILKWIQIHYSDYFITNQRLVFRNNFFRRTQNLPLNKIPKITVEKYNPNTGYIIFGEPELWSGRPNKPWYQGRGVNYHPDKFIFENINDVGLIHLLIKEAQKGNDPTFPKRTYSDTYADISYECQLHLEKVLNRHLSLQENNAIRNAGSLMMLESFSNSILNSETEEQATLILDDILKVKRLNDYLLQFNSFLKEQNHDEYKVLNDSILNKGNCLDLMILKKDITDKKPSKSQLFIIFTTFIQQLEKRN